jgi:hypothetical protein
MGSALPVLVFIGAMVVATMCWRFSVAMSTPIPQLAQLGDFVSIAGVIALVVGFVYFGYRLWAWEKGRADPCVRCDGPLGRVRSGKVYFGRQLSEYRECYNCGKPNSEAAD